MQERGQRGNVDGQWLEDLALYACRLTSDGKLIECNRRFARLLGMDAESLQGKALASLASANHQRGLLEAIFVRGRQDVSTIADFADLTFTGPGEAAEREVRWFFTSYIHESGASGEEILGLGWDEGGHKQMERFLLRLARVADLTDGCVVIASSRGVIEYVNPAFTERSGYGHAEVIGRSLSGIVRPPEEMGALQKAMAAFSRGDTWQGKLTLRCQDGSAIELGTRVVPVRDSDKRITHYIAIGRDISRQRALERQVEELQRLEALGSLANGLAHRFNNILAAISGQTELLAMAPAVDPQVKRRAEKILAAVSKGKEAVEQISQFGRKTETRSRPADLVPVARNALNLIQAAASAKLNLYGNLPEDAPPVMANTEQIHQVLINLLGNALDALGESQGEVFLDLKVADRHLPERKEAQPCVVITVRDTGPGIPKEILHRIFEPFFTTHSLASSSGMGLAISHSIVSRHGGMLSVQSRPGEGSTFEVALPVLQEQAAAPGAGWVGTPQVLLVDGHRFSQESGVRLLSRMKLHVTACSTASDAVAALAAGRFDLMILDLRLPDSAGADLVYQVLRMQPGLPLILCAAVSDDIEHLVGELPVKVEVVRKPVPVDQLITIVERLLRGRAAQDSCGNAEAGCQDSTPVLDS